jgi:hypothetical protein
MNIWLILALDFNMKSQGMIIDTANRPGHKIQDVIFSIHVIMQIGPDYIAVESVEAIDVRG